MSAIHRFDGVDKTVCGIHLTSWTTTRSTVDPAEVTCLRCMEDWQLEDGSWVNDGTPRGEEFDAEIRRRTEGR